MRSDNGNVIRGCLAVTLLLTFSGCMGSQYGTGGTVPPSTIDTGGSAGQEHMLLVSDKPGLGAFLTDERGMTLYRFTNDEPGKSNCYGGCAAAWPPLTSAGDVAAGDGVGGVVDYASRSDGSRQVTYNGVPLYYYAPDRFPGDVKGQGVGGVWFVVAPSAEAAAGAVTTSTTEMATSTTHRATTTTVADETVSSTTTTAQPKATTTTVKRYSYGGY